MTRPTLWLLAAAAAAAFPTGVLAQDDEGQERRLRVVKRLGGDDDAKVRVLRRVARDDDAAQQQDQESHSEKRIVVVRNGETIQDERWVDGKKVEGRDDAAPRARIRIGGLEDIEGLEEIEEIIERAGGQGDDRKRVLGRRAVRRGGGDEMEDALKRMRELESELADLRRQIEARAKGDAKAEAKAEAKGDKTETRTEKRVIVIENGETVKDERWVDGKRMDGDDKAPKARRMRIRRGDANEDDSAPKARRFRIRRGGDEGVDTIVEQAIDGLDIEAVLEEALGGIEGLDLEELNIDLGDAKVFGPKGMQFKWNGEMPHGLESMDFGDVDFDFDFDMDFDGEAFEFDDLGDMFDGPHGLKFDVRGLEDLEGMFEGENGIHFHLDGLKGMFEGENGVRFHIGGPEGMFDGEFDFSELEEMIDGAGELDFSELHGVLDGKNVFKFDVEGLDGLEGAFKSRIGIDAKALEELPEGFFKGMDGDGPHTFMWHMDGDDFDASELHGKILKSLNLEDLPEGVQIFWDTRSSECEGCDECEEECCGECQTDAKEAPKAAPKSTKKKLSARRKVVDL